jgi:MFS family permease
VFRWVAIGVGLLVAGLLGFVIAAIFLGPDFRGAWRDVFIVILAALQLVGAFLTIALLIAVLYVVNQLNKVARTNVLPKLDETMLKVNDVLDNTRTLVGNVQQSVSNAANTTGFVTERVVSPIIRVSSLISGVRAAATTLARRDATPDVEP